MKMTPLKACFFYEDQLHLVTTFVKKYVLRLILVCSPQPLFNIHKTYNQNILQTCKYSFLATSYFTNKLLLDFLNKHFLKMYQKKNTCTI